MDYHTPDDLSGSTPLHYNDVESFWIIFTLVTRIVILDQAAGNS
jgi:hypothetical protein